MECKRIIVIGCGGRGSNVIPHIARLIKTQYPYIQLILCDGDKIENKNLNRQIGFFEEDLDKNKAEILAKQINYMYNINCMFIDRYWTENDFIKLNINYNDIILTEVDNHATRLLFHQQLYNKNYFWIDGTNDKESGSTFICRNWKDSNTNQNLLISRFDYYPTIMQELDKHPNELSCADHVASGEQDYSVNILGAAIDFSILERYLKETLLDIYHIQYNTNGISSIEFIKEYENNKKKLRINRKIGA